MQLGGHGVISVTANVAAREMADMCKLAAEGQFAEARAINQRLMPLHNKLFVEPNPIPVKWACKALSCGDRHAAPANDTYHGPWS